jgi:hypothetical protein
MEQNRWRAERGGGTVIQVTADMFSGRPNPTLVVQSDEAREILREISQNRSIVSAVHEKYQGLGYRGLIVEALSDNVTNRYDLPATFRIANDGQGKGLEIAERVLDSMRKADLVDDALHALTIQELQRLNTQEDSTEADHSEPPIPPENEGFEKGAHAGVRRKGPVTCWIELGAFNPGFWNDPTHIGRNNCYNYASNRRTDTFAQPGRATGHQATVMACSNVIAAALSDGLHHRFDCFPDPEKPRWLMALVVAPGYDYHWYRKQKEGFWGHKPGHTAARNVDNNGAIVWNPETAARLPYTNFCGYFYACKSQKIN